MRTLLSFALLFALCTQPLLGEAQTNPGGPISEPVKDTSGNNVRAGADYFIRPVTTIPAICRRPGCGTGFALASTTPNKTCPLNVVVVGGNGQPVKFTPVSPNKDGVITTSTDLNVRFDVKTNCAESTVWRLQSDGSTGKRIVSTGGVIGNPGKNTISNWFKILKDGNDYSLQFCPTVCNTCRPACGNIGVVQDSNGNVLVGISDQPYKIRFQKSS